MIDLLKQILCAIVNLAYKLADLLVMLCNALVGACGAFLGFLLALLPNFPDAPDAPEGILGYANWFFPIGGLLAGLAVFGVLWATFLLIRIALKWMQAL